MVLFLFIVNLNNKERNSINVLSIFNLSFSLLSISSLDKGGKEEKEEEMDDIYTHSQKINKQTRKKS